MAVTIINESESIDVEVFKVLATLSTDKRGLFVLLIDYSFVDLLLKNSNQILRTAYFNVEMNSKSKNMYLRANRFFDKIISFTI